jgi:hypothetical protein
VAAVAGGQAQGRIAAGTATSVLGVASVAIRMAARAAVRGPSIKAARALVSASVAAGGAAGVAATAGSQHKTRLAACALAGTITNAGGTLEMAFQAGIS